MTRDVIEQTALSTYSAPSPVSRSGRHVMSQGAVSGEDSAPCGDAAAVLAALRDGATRWTRSLREFGEVARG